jgi:hypothetical protein
MKKIFAVVAAVALLSIAAVASAHMMGWGGGPGYGGPGCGGQGYGPGYGMRMHGWGPGYALSDEDRKLLDETADLRKELFSKRFDYREALRSGDDKKAEAIGKDMEGLQAKLREKLGPGFGGGYGMGPARGGGWQCPGPYGR